MQNVPSLPGENVPKLPFDFCTVCGIPSSGKNYENIKRSIKALRDKSFWVQNENGKDVLVGWLSSATISRGSGRINIRLDEQIEKYVIGLKDNYMQFSLIYTLPMKSAYSYRLYELLKSYDGFPHHTFTIEELKQMLQIQVYDNFKDFRVNVLDRATREINLYTDLEISWEPMKEGKKYSKITFYIKRRDAWSALEAQEFSNRAIDGQLTNQELKSREKEVNKTEQ